MLDLSARKVYGALEEAVNAIDAKVDNAILSIYKAGGSLEFDDLPSPSSDVANMAYLVTDAFTTTSDFVEGAGVDYPAGTYVAIVNTGTEDDPDYKYDVVPFTMVVDDTMSAVSENPLQNKVITGAVQEIRLDISNLSASKISKSETVGHVMNDGSIDENEYTEKVENATSGHLAGLDSNGNLTDSGVSPTEDVTVEGNPVTFDSPFEQDAKSVVVSVKPIQDLHGYDHPWPAGGGKNKFDKDNQNVFTGFIEISTHTFTSSPDGLYKTAYIHCIPNTTYTISKVAGKTFRVADSAMVPADGVEYINTDANHTGTSITFTTSANAQYLAVLYWSSANHDTLTPDELAATLQIEIGSSPTSYAPYSNICPISGIDEVEIEVSDGESEPTTTTISLPSTLYDADVDVTEGSADSRYGYIASYNGETLPGAWISDRDVYTGSNSPTIGAEVAYELATPTTLSFTPADVELLEGTNVVSTNAEKVAVTYGRSLWQDIDDLKNDTEGKLDKSDVATIEGDTASRPYSVNEFMLRSDGFYKVTQPIAQNASITASNTEKTTIGAVLTALLNA